MTILSQKEARPWFDRLVKLYAAHAKPENAEPMARYMKDRFRFFGIKSPERKALSRAFFRQEGLPGPEVLGPLFQLCFDAPQRELQYFVQDAGRRMARHLDATFLPVYDGLIGRKSWWDSVDFLAPKLAGPLLRRHPEAIPEYPDRWIEHPNFWYQRSAILFQLDFKEDTDAERLFHYIRRRADSAEFFVQKGAGWALRQYSKVAPEAVRHFIEGHRLATLTEREGMKWIRRQESKG